MWSCTSFDGAISVQTANWLNTRDVNRQPAAAVPPPGYGDAQRRSRFLLQAHRLLLTGKTARWIL